MTGWITIYGAPPSKSNSYRIGNKRIFKSADVHRYENDFAIQSGPLHSLNIKCFDLYARVFYPDKRQDLDGCTKVVLDCLQQVGAIQNDRYCQEIHLTRHIDKEKPRIELKLIDLHCI